MLAPGAAPRRLTGPDAQDAWPTWSPDGEWLAFARSRGPGGVGRIHVVGVDGRGLRRLTSGSDHAPSWSPDGATIAFVRGRSVFAVDASGGDERLLLRDAEEPQWAPDGARIAFVDVEADAIGIFDVRSGERRIVVRAGRSPNSPSWSPDGTRIAYAGIPEDAPSVESTHEAHTLYELFVADADGGSTTRLTENTSHEGHVAWAASGELLFSSDRGGRLTIYAMGADGRDVRPLLGEP